MGEAQRVFRAPEVRGHPTVLVDPMTQRLLDRMHTPSRPVEDGWCLYLIECRNGSWYAGITNDLQARYAAHVAGRGARYTRANPPLRLLGYRGYPNRSSAARAEWAIKQLPRQRKLAFLHGESDLADTGASP